MCQCKSPSYRTPPSSRHTPAPQHKHIVRLYHVFRAKQSVWLVQELCKGGELFDRIVEKVSGFDLIQLIN